MIGLDTNVLLRYLLKDDQVQWEQAVQVLETGETFFISNLVLCELCWVLQSRYKLSRTEIVEVVQALLDTDAFQFENRLAVQSAIGQMQQGKAGLADYLIGFLNQQAGCTKTVTFDRKLTGEEYWAVL